MEKTIIAAMIPVVMMASGCASKQEEGDVAKQWNDNSRQLGFYPIFPPGGDYFPGDVYLTPFSPAHGKSKIPSEFYTVTPMKYTSISVSNDLPVQPDFQATEESPGENGAVIKPQPFLNYPASGARSNNIVAFPGISFASVSSGSFGIGFPANSWAAKLGLARKSEYSVTYNVPNAESIDIDYSAGLDKFISLRKSVNSAKLNFLGDKMKAYIDDIQSSVRKDANIVPGIIFVTTVYYARSLDVTISSADGFGASASATLSELANLSDQKAKLMAELNKIPGGASAVEGGNTGSPDASSDQAKKAQTIQSQVDGINTQMSQLSKSMAPAAPGATGSVTQATANTITLRQVFKYPVAIGYRGIAVTIPEFLQTSALFNPGVPPTSSWPHPPLSPTTPYQEQRDIGNGVLLNVE